MLEVYGYASRFVGPKIDCWDIQLPISVFFGLPNFDLLAFKFVNVLLKKMYISTIPYNFEYMLNT